MGIVTSIRINLVANGFIVHGIYRTGKTDEEGRAYVSTDREGVLQLVNEFLDRALKEEEGEEEGE